jgi:hypothetical protein
MWLGVQTTMSNEILGPLIGAGGAITAALIAWLAALKLQDRASSKYRRDLGLVDPRGRWKCDWFNEDGSLYVSDVIEIESWVNHGAFKGRGVQPDLSYTVRGEIDSTRTMALTYRTEDFPTTAYVGVACLAFDVGGKSLIGRWYGRTRTGEFSGGKTEWRRNLAT